MKYFGVITLPLLLLSANASALTCKKVVHFIIRCQDDICSEGFFAPRRMAGERCKTILDVQSNEPIQKFDGQFGSLRKSDSEKLNGYYRIEVLDRLNPYDKSVENLRCFKRNENGDFSLTCHDEFTKLEKLDYQPEQEISFVISEMVNQSRKERALNWLMHILLPGVTLILMIWAGRRFRKPHGNKIAIAVFAVSSIGITQLLWGRGLWFLTSIVGWLFCFIWIVTKLIVRFRAREKKLVK